MEVVIGLGVLAALYYFSKQGQVPTGTVTPPLPSTVANPIIQSAALVSGGYQITPDGTMLANPDAVQLAAQSAAGLFSTPPPTTLPPPPPYVAGGIAGNVGTGGNPLGGVLRPGVSSGTATTSLPTPAYTDFTPAQARQLASRGYVILAGKAYAPGTPLPVGARWAGVQVIA